MSEPTAKSVVAAEPPTAFSRVRALIARNQIIYPLLGFVLLCIVMICVSRQFLTPQNISNITLQVSTNAVLAVGMTFVILTGGIDLSVGAVMALSMTIIAGSMLAGVPPPLAIVLGCLTGLAFGCFNGFIVSYGRLPSIIVTLGAMEISRGIGLLYTKGYPFSGLPDSYAFIGRGSIAGVPVAVIIMLCVFAVAWIILTFFPIGRYIYGIGGNEDAVRLSGVPVRRYKFLVYAFSGLTSGIAAVILSSRLMSGQPNAGMGFELDAIAAVVLGGTSIAGGRGHIVGTLIGALTLGVLNNGLNLMGVSPYTQKVLKGVIILLAVYASNVKKDK